MMLYCSLGFAVASLVMFKELFNVLFAVIFFLRKIYGNIMAYCGFWPTELILFKREMQAEIKLMSAAEWLVYGATLHIEALCMVLIYIYICEGRMSGWLSQGPPVGGGVLHRGGFAVVKELACVGVRFAAKLLLR